MKAPLEKTPLQIEVQRLLDDPTTRLVKRPDQKRISGQAWSEDAGLGKTFVKDILRKPSAQHGAENLIKLANAIEGLSPTHFIDIEQKVIQESRPAASSRHRDPSIEGRTLDHTFPSTHTATKGFRELDYVLGHPDPEWGDHVVDKEMAEPPVRRLLRVETDRMAPRFLVGETIAIERVAPKDGDHVWIELKTPNGAEKRPAMLRLLKEQDSTTLTVIQYSPRRHQSTIERKKVAAIYRVLSSDDLLLLLGARLQRS